MKTDQMQMPELHSSVYWAIRVDDAWYGFSAPDPVARGKRHRFDDKDAAFRSARELRRIWPTKDIGVVKVSYKCKSTPYYYVARLEICDWKPSVYRTAREAREALRAAMEDRGCSEIFPSQTDRSAFIYGWVQRASFAE